MKTDTRSLSVPYESLGVHNGRCSQHLQALNYTGIIIQPADKVAENLIKFIYSVLEKETEAVSNKQS